MSKTVIKNIMWDVDGVLAQLDHAYYRLLTEYPQFKSQYEDLQFEDLAEALPIAPKFGTLELTTHPTLGTELNHEFCHNSGEIYFDRPLYPNAIEILKELNDKNYLQLTMSAGFDKAVKEKMIKQVLGDELSFVNIEVVEHNKTANDGHSKAMVGEKEQRILDCLEKYNLKAEETVFVDDRIFNCETGLKVGMHVVRAAWCISTPTPTELLEKGVIEAKTILEFKKWLNEETFQGPLKKE